MLPGGSQDLHPPPSPKPPCQAQAGLIGIHTWYVENVTGCVPRASGITNECTRVSDSGSRCFAYLDVSRAWFMAPKRSVQELGSISSKGDGWRVQVFLQGCMHVGSTHVLQRDAQADLEHIRRASSREHMLQLLNELKDDGAGKPIAPGLCGETVIEEAADLQMGDGAHALDSRNNGMHQRVVGDGFGIRNENGGDAEPSVFDALARGVGSRVEPQRKRLRGKTTAVESSGALSAVPERTLSAVDADEFSPAGLGQKLSLRGLNIQWPFSQLILAGAKKTEVRSHVLGDKPHIARSGEVMWLIETPGPSANANTNAVAEDVAIGPRPHKAQIVGTTTFSHSEQYANLIDFRADATQHCIREGGEKDWTDSKHRHAWRIGAVRSLAKPIPAPEDKSMTGLATPRTFEVVFKNCSGTSAPSTH